MHAFLTPLILKHSLQNRNDLSRPKLLRASACDLASRAQIRANLSVLRARNVRQDAYLYADPENRALCGLWATTGSYSRHLTDFVSYLRSQFFC